MLRQMGHMSASSSSSASSWPARAHPSAELPGQRVVLGQTGFAQVDPQRPLEDLVLVFACHGQGFLSLLEQVAAADQGADGEASEGGKFGVSAALGRL